MRRQKLLFFGLCFFLATLFASCGSVRVKHGKDCGCGSFGQLELKQDHPQ